MSNIKRMSLYFNLDNPIEKSMWEYLENTRKKSDTIKNSLLSTMNNAPVMIIPTAKKETNDLGNEELDLGDEKDNW